MGRSKQARQRQAAYKAIKQGLEVSEEQQQIVASHSSDVAKQRLARVRVMTKGDRSQQTDRRDGIGTAIGLGGGSAENVGRLRAIRVTLDIEHSNLVQSGLSASSNGVADNATVIKTVNRFTRLTVLSYQLVEIGRFPYLRLVDASGDSRLLAIGAGDRISQSWLIKLQSWLSSESIISLQKEWLTLKDRANDYRP